jgi:hypothetical protein
MANTNESYDLSEKKAIELMIECAGNISPQAMGVIATLTEHVFWSLTSGEPVLEKWTPKAAMTELQQIEHANRHLINI